MRALLLSTPARARLAAAGALLLLLAALAPVGGSAPATLARWVLGAAVMAGLGAGWVYRGRVASGLLPPEPMRVVSRTGLSPRCGLALVEVEGRRYLVAYGDSFAEIRRTPGPMRAQVRARSGAVRRAGPVRGEGGAS